MDNSRSHQLPGDGGKSRSGCFRFLKIAALAIVIIAVIVAVWVKMNIYASTFTPTRLSEKEQAVLETKLERLGQPSREESLLSKVRKPRKKKRLRPEAYTEVGAKREISLSEKELNALIANNPDIAEKVAIDLSDDLVSVKLVIPVDDDVPVLGGKTLRFNMGIILGYEDNRAVVAMKGISIGGIPLPNAWLGYMKNRNLVDEFGTEGGFWHIFSEGVQDIKVRDGQLLIRLRE